MGFIGKTPVERLGNEIPRSKITVQRCSLKESKITCRPNGTEHYWPAVACCPVVSYVKYASVTDDDRRRQTPATVTSLAPLYIICRRASNNRRWFLLRDAMLARYMLLSR